MPSFVQLRTISLGIPARPATHNPLVHGSSPCEPITFEGRALRGFLLPASAVIQTQPASESRASLPAR